MGQSLQNIKPIEGINVDIAAKYLKNTQVRYALNLERSFNNDAAGLLGNNANVSTPAHGNLPITYPQPAGDNLRIGEYYSKVTNELYVWVYNSLSNHHIYRVNADNTVNVLLVDPKLNFSADLRYRIRHAHLFYNHDSTAERGNKLFRKYLVWVAGDNWQGFLDVETAFATNGFTVPYFNTPDRTQLWQLAPRPSLLCPEASYDPTVDPLQANLIKDVPWQFRIQFVYTDARQSAWSPISELLVPDTLCLAENQAQCINLRLDAGGPHVEKIRLAFRNCVGSLTADQTPEWFETDLIEKYDECLGSTMPFYQRTIRNDAATNFVYDAATNTFLYKFCNTGTCLPIDKAETDRNFNNIPKTSFCMVPLEKKIALINNTWGDNALDCAELAKITIAQQERPPHCEPELVTVKVAVIIHQMVSGGSDISGMPWPVGLNQPVYVYENVVDEPGMEDKIKYYGGLRKRFKNTTHSGNPKLFNQHFEGTTGGFLVYVEGAEASARTEQNKCVGAVYQKAFVGDIDHTNEIISASLLNHEYYFIQVAKLSVVRGTKGVIRLASQLAGATSDYRNTSAAVQGIFYDRATDYDATVQITEKNTDMISKEIYFEACDPAVDEIDLTNTPFIVADLAVPDNGGGVFGIGGDFFGAAVTGYLRDLQDKPVSGAWTRAGGDYIGPYANVSGTVSDYNGFYFASFPYNEGQVDDTIDIGLNFYIEGPECGEEQIGGQVRTKFQNGVVNASSLLVDAPDYEKNYQILLKIKVEDPAGNPMAGIPISLQRAKGSTTGVDGFAYITLRREMTDQITHPLPPRHMMIMQRATCYLTQEDCDSCMPDIDITGVLEDFAGNTYELPDCYKAIPPDVQPLIYEIGNFTQINLFSTAFEYGYHPGGVYPFAIKLMDAAGRETFAEKGVVVAADTIQHKGRFSFNDFYFDLANFKAPAEYVRMSLLIGPNRAFDDFVCWAVDDVSFVDSSGTGASPAGASKILLSIRSLYDTANMYAYGTNVKYSWVKGDRVEIIANADGKIYPDVLQYNIEADYNNLVQPTLAEGEKRFNQLVISFDDKLTDLKVGALIQITRKLACEPAELYFECCQTIELDQGVPKVTAGRVTGFDTYFVRRGINWDQQTHIFPFPFLHHSPSDFWGDHCVSRGRVSSVNEYRKRLQYGREMRISNAFLQNGNYNGLGTFEDENVKTFTGEQRGDIVYAISKEQIFMMICERDNFIINSATDYVRVAANGQLVALPPDNLVSEAQVKIVGNYGCRYEDIDSVVVGDGWVFWIDRMNKLPVFNDWQQARDASVHPQDGPQVSSYFKTKFRFFPQNGQIVCGYDSVSNNIMVTFRYFPDDYVHSRREFDFVQNETIAFCATDWRWPTTYSFTPEGYSCFPGNDAGEVFIVFAKGLPYLHRAVGSTVFNSFFGVAADEVFEFIINELPEKVKGFLAMQLQTDIPWFADRITSSLGHTSRLPPAFAKKLTEGKFDCHFLMDERKDLYNGPQLRGNWLRVRMVRDNSVNYGWNTIDPAKQVMYSEFDRIIARFQFSEQSAYNTSNTDDKTKFNELVKRVQDLASNTNP